MNIIFLYGPPGVGKLTVGQKLSQLTGYKLFHNHLTVDLVYSLFDFKTKPFIELRDKIWMLVFSKAKEERINGMIFTFAPEDSVPMDFIPRLIKLIEDGKDKIYFVKLICTPEELMKRILNPSRQKYFKDTKTVNVDKFYKRDYLIPENVLKRTLHIDNTNLEPDFGAKKIINHFQIE
ncbi:AAA family ATPase [Candidatus Gottesmanbacteria bacterium]|nr:AAA family ATPase [Candidatus Gottesmanbacteria bacterium]